MNDTLIPVDYILKAAKAVKRIAYLIAVIGAVTSFGTQVELLESWGITPAFAWGIASTVDLLAICAAIALQVPGFPDRSLVGSILVFALTASITANMIAGLRVSLGSGVGHAWPVVAYMFAELIASRMRRFAAVVQARKLAAAQPTPVETVAPVHATATVAPPKAVTSKPGTAKERILQLAAATPPLSPEAIADQVGVKPGWVKHVIKTKA
jgi:hypothetical protein